MACFPLAPGVVGQGLEAAAGTLQNEMVLLIDRRMAFPFLPLPCRPWSDPVALGRSVFLTCMRPKVVLHGGGCEERVMAGGPGALERLLSRVQLHVVLQCPLLCEAPVTQLTCKFPG